MPKHPTKKELQLWIPAATDIFRSIMPLVSTPFPQTYIVDGRNFLSTRKRIVKEIACHQVNAAPEEPMMEYLHGDKGCAILIRQNLLPDDNDEHFCWFYWHELGHFYAINEDPALHRYTDPGLVDDSRLIDYTDGSLALSDERMKQHGYWFWQEFIAEAISKYVSFKHRVTFPTYHPEKIDWHPDIWGQIPDRLTNLLEATLIYYPMTIDEYSLAHYFATLLMDDLVKLYVKAADEGKLRVYRDGTDVMIPEEHIEPTCISDMEEAFQPALWRLKELLEKQLDKENFWITTEESLLEFGRCIGELMLAKLRTMSDCIEQEVTGCSFEEFISKLSDG